MALVRASAWSGEALGSLAAPVARTLFGWTLAVVLGRVLNLTWAHGPRLATVWIVKLVTDPLTDLIAYVPGCLATSKALLRHRRPA